MPDLPAIARKAARLDAEIKARQDELAALKAALVEGGAADYGVCKVIFPSPSLKATDMGLATVKELAGAHFKKLVESVQVFKPVKGFREVAAALFKPAQARAIVAAFEVESSLQVRFS